MTYSLRMLLSGMWGKINELIKLLCKIMKMHHNKWITEENEKKKNAHVLFSEYDYMCIPKCMNIPIAVEHFFGFKNGACKHSQCFNDTQSFHEIKQ